MGAPSKADDVSCSPGRVADSLNGSHGSAPRQLWQMTVRVSVSWWSRSFQMLADIFLQFSALCSCFNSLDRKEIIEKGKWLPSQQTNRPMD
jgi:hypothetical protein